MEIDTSGTADNDVVHLATPSWESVNLTNVEQTSLCAEWRCLPRSDIACNAPVSYEEERGIDCCGKKMNDAAADILILILLFFICL